MPIQSLYLTKTVTHLVLLGLPRYLRVSAAAVALVLAGLVVRRTVVALLPLVLLLAPALAPTSGVAVAFR